MSSVNTLTSMLGAKAKGQLVFYPEVMNREVQVSDMKNQNGNANDTTVKLLCNRSLVKHGSNNAGFGKTTGKSKDIVIK